MDICIAAFDTVAKLIWRKQIEASQSLETARSRRFTKPAGNPTVDITTILSKFMTQMRMSVECPLLVVLHWSALRHLI